MRYVSLNGFICYPQAGGYWSVTSKGQLVACWITKAEVRSLVRGATQ